MKRLFTLITGVSVAAAVYAAGNYEVSGVVLSAEDGEPLIGASVMVPGTATGTSTDIDGKFTLSVPDGVKTLRASYVGTKPVDFSVSRREIPEELNGNAVFCDAAPISRMVGKPAFPFGGKGVGFLKICQFRHESLRILRQS